jgi:hypothetical protein
VDNQNDGKLDQSIKEIIESDIFEYLELDTIPDEEKTKMMENLIISLRSRVMLRIADILEQKDPTIFENFKQMLAGNPNQGEIEKVFQDNEINVDVITAEEAILLKAEVMGLKQAKARG